MLFPISVCRQSTQTRRQHTMVFIVLGIILLVLMLAVLIGSYIVYRMTFGRNDKRIGTPEEFPDTPFYTPYAEVMTKNIKAFLEIPYEDVYTTSFDGLKLHAKFYEGEKDKPVLIFFHGYRSNATRDGSGIHSIGNVKGINILVVTQRAHNESEGKTITFGIHESRDCLSWIDYVKERFGEDKKVILWGISMGASTVLTAAGRDLPENVLGIGADCGYSSAKDILRCVIKGMKIPVGPSYWLVKLGARIYGGFDVEATSPLEAMKKVKVPVLFIHGEADDFVPCDMTHQNYEACVSDKSLVLVKEAGHGMSYYVDMKKTEEGVYAFLDKIIKEV